MGIKMNFDGGSLEAAVWKQTKQVIERRARSVRCPEHGCTASLTWTRGGGSRMPSNPQFEIRACCDQLAQMARAAVPD